VRQPELRCSVATRPTPTRRAIGTTAYAYVRASARSNRMAPALSTMCLGLLATSANGFQAAGSLPASRAMSRSNVANMQVAEATVASPVALAKVR
jgi:hypothetical protein